MKHITENNLEGSHIKIGRFIMSLISKKEVDLSVPAPSQKLIIVDACPKTEYVVSITSARVDDPSAMMK